MSKTFTAVVIVTLSLAIVAIYHTLDTKDPSEQYSNRLANIAKQINSEEDLSWKAAEPTNFKALSFSEAKSLMGALMTEKKLPAKSHQGLGEAIEEDLPEEFNSITQWPKCKSITLILDQVNCGSCWAFAAVEAMSDRICIASGQKINPILSSTELLTCCYRCSVGCQGGWLLRAWKYWKNNGIVTGGIYGDKTTCQPDYLPKCAHYGKSKNLSHCKKEMYYYPDCSESCQSSF